MSDSADGYEESVGQYTDLKPALNASTPVHTVTENVGDSESIARGFAERATGNPDDFETREEAVSKPSSEDVNGDQDVNGGSPPASTTDEEPERIQSASNNDKKEPERTQSASNNEKKEPETTPEKVDEAEKAILEEAKELNGQEPAKKDGYPALILLSGAVVAAGSVIGAIFLLTKKKKSQS